MPFLGMPLRFNVPARRVGQDKFLRFSNARLLLRFRPTTFDPDPNDRSHLREAPWPSENDAQAIQRPLLAIHAPGLFLDVVPADDRQLLGGPQIDKGYWQLVDLGDNDRGSRIVELRFRGEDFTADLIAGGGQPDEVELRQRLHDAFVEQCTIQLVLSLDAAGNNIGELLLKLEYEILEEAPAAAAAPAGEEKKDDYEQGASEDC